MQKTENYGLNLPEKDEFYEVEKVNENTRMIDEKLKEIEVAANPDALNAHTKDKDNPHGVTAAQIGLGNVPNVPTNDQTPVYTVPSELAEMSSGEKLSVAFGKIAKVVKSLIAHLKDTTAHVTSTEKASWNAKADGNHYHTEVNGVTPEWSGTLDYSETSYVATWTGDGKKIKGTPKTSFAPATHGHSISEIANFPTSMPPTAHGHSVSEISGFPSTMPPSEHNQSASTVTAGTLQGAVVANASAVASIGTKQIRNISAGTAELTDGVSALPTGDIYFQIE